MCSLPSKEVDGGLFASPTKFVVLGIDPSLTGFAVTALSSHGQFHSWLYKSSHKGVDRLIDISMFLSMKIQDLQSRNFDVHDVAIEDSVVMSHSAVVLGELHGTLKVALRNALPRSRGKYPQKIPPTMVKKFATDRGNAKKNEVMLAVYKKWGVEFRDDNLADSYVLARIGAGMADTEYEKTVLSKLGDAAHFRDAAQV